MSTISIRCGHCGDHVGAEVKATTGSAGVQWLQCPVCRDGSVMTLGGAIYPPAPAGRPVAHLPDEVDNAWGEARRAFSVAAYTAVEMLCRKILMYVAVDKAGSKERENFTVYLDDLNDEGYIVPGMKGKVDQVRQRGGHAAHRVPRSTEQDALNALEITDYLLRGTYEIPGPTP